MKRRFLFASFAFLALIGVLFAFTDSDQIAGNDPEAFVPPALDKPLPDIEGQRVYIILIPDSIMGIEEYRACGGTCWAEEQLRGTKGMHFISWYSCVERSWSTVTDSVGTPLTYERPVGDSVVVERYGASIANTLAIHELVREIAKSPKAGTHVVLVKGEPTCVGIGEKLRAVADGVQIFTFDPEKECVYR